MKKRKEMGIINRLKQSFFLVGFLSIIWYVIRTGRKPSRSSYPCQQAAAINGKLWIVSYIVPIFSGLQLNKIGFLRDKRVLLTATIVIIAGGIGYNWYQTQQGLVTVESATLDNGLTLSANTAVNTPSSDIFAVTRTTGGDGGVNTLIRLMGSQGLHLYQSESSGPVKSPDGLITNDDVIIIKVNCQWDERGGTNTDLLRSLIQALLEHPDGFTGEIIVADNGQGETRGSGSLGGSFTYTNNNGVDVSISIQDLVDEFSGNKVSTYLWSEITDTRAYEFDKGDMTDGYVVEDTLQQSTQLMVSYPKFTTEFGTCISFKKGVWNPTNENYDSDRLKVINLSMLKSHQVYGVTASIKNYMGVPSDVLTSQITGQTLHTHYSIGRGGMGTMMVNTRYPVLNLIDAIWINPIPLNGPNTYYSIATQINIITASTDPVALDYWSVKNILLQNWRNRSGETSTSMDPDNTESGFFGDWLRLSMNELLNGGYLVNIDESYMNVYIADNLDNQ